MEHGLVEEGIGIYRLSDPDDYQVKPHYLQTVNPLFTNESSLTRRGEFCRDGARW